MRLLRISVRLNVKYVLNLYLFGVDGLLIIIIYERRHLFSCTTSVYDVEVKRVDRCNNNLPLDGSSA